MLFAVDKSRARTGYETVENSRFFIGAMTPMIIPRIEATAGGGKELERNTMTAARRSRVLSFVTCFSRKPRSKGERADVAEGGVDDSGAGFEEALVDSDPLALLGDRGRDRGSLTDPTPFPPSALLGVLDRTPSSEMRWNRLNNHSIWRTCKQCS